jgi:uncharacterized protein
MFDWDPKKAKANQLKHGVSFEEATTAFLDPDGLDGEDLEHSLGEPRRLRLAKSSTGRVLVIAYTERSRGHEEITRIISARRASRKERKSYEAKEDWLFGHSGAFREAAFPYAPGREADGGWGTEKTHRDTVRSESLGVVAWNRWEEGIALSVARQSDLGGGNEEGKLGREIETTLSSRSCLMPYGSLWPRQRLRNKRLGFSWKKEQRGYGRT